MSILRMNATSSETLGVFDDRAKASDRAGLPVILGCNPTDIIRPRSSPSLRNRSRQALPFQRNVSGPPCHSQDVARR
jgi:hypothetical protein